MMSLLIDTSGQEGFIAVAQEGTLIQTFPLPPGKDLSKIIFKYLLSFPQYQFAFIAIGKGPGSFTGTRVGAIIGQALAFGWQLPLIGFSSTLTPERASVDTYTSFLEGKYDLQIELVYISPTA